jgi:hypothetical protein
MKVQFSSTLDSPLYPDLTLGRVYEVIGLEADNYRLLNDGGLPYLYPPELFTLVELDEPEDWVSSRGEDGERYAYPMELNEPGFFEDYFDSEPVAVLIFQKYLLHQQAMRYRMAELV